MPASKQRRKRRRQKEWDMLIQLNRVPKIQLASNPHFPYGNCDVRGLILFRASHSQYHLISIDGSQKRNTGKLLASNFTDDANHTDRPATTTAKINSGKKK